MSPIDFDLLRFEYPDLKDIWSELDGWFRKNRQKGFVELDVLTRAFPQKHRLHLILALQAMTDMGMLANTYRVRAPGGYLLEGEYDEPDRIPEEIEDRELKPNPTSGLSEVTANDHKCQQRK